jgi:hypothetical protein
MKKNIFLKILVVLILLQLLESCAGMSVGYGVNFGVGPYGPTISPSFNVGMYGGGGYYW